MFEAAHHSHPAQFQDHLLQQGYQGGQLAARTLLSSLPSLASHAEISPTSATHSGEIVVDATGAVISVGTIRVEGEMRELGSVVVMVFLNKSGLGSTLVKVGAVRCAMRALYGRKDYCVCAGTEEQRARGSGDRVKDGTMGTMESMDRRIVLMIGPGWSGTHLERVRSVLAGVLGRPRTLHGYVVVSVDALSPGLKSLISSHRCRTRQGGHRRQDQRWVVCDGHHGHHGHRL